MHNEFICRKSDSELSFHKVGGMIYPKLQLVINSNILKISSLPQKEMVLIQSMPTIILYPTKISQCRKLFWMLHSVIRYFFVYKKVKNRSDSDL